MMTSAPNETFWDHLEVLRHVLWRVLAATCLLAVGLFCCKEALFDVVLAPRSPSFAPYRLFAALGADVEAFRVELINTELAAQFMIHVRMAFSVALLLASPYVLFELFGFIAPALYAHERRYALKAVGGSYFLFLVGVAVGYFLIFPLTFRFLGMYQVANDVPNLITLQSYVSTLLMLCLTLGVVFEMPVLCWLLGRLHLLTRHRMRAARRHALVGILLVSAIITPTGDAFTLLVVALPIWGLYELSAFCVPKG